MQLGTLAKKAETSKFNLWLLNFVLLRKVPFNLPHKPKIISLANNEVTMCVTTRRKNLNHLKGIHACLLATLCEYVSGFFRRIETQCARTHRLDSRNQGSVRSG